MHSSAGRREIQPPGLTHAYASTANAVQGRTAERAYVLVAEAGMYRQAAYVAASRARLETHFFALASADADELDCPSRPGVGLPPDPDEARALAEAMARDASQTMASAADPMAAAVGDLVARPTPWLAAERAEVAARLGASPALPEALRRVRVALADTYGLAPDALECRPLDDAMTRALAVPGATVERLIELVHSRQRPGTRELLTARDPVAVMVWAAGTYATGVLEAEARLRAEGDDRRPEVRRQEAEDQARLALLDAALVRQRAGRLALAETERHGPVAELLGPPPTHVAGLRAWRGAAAAVVDYRDAAGLFVGSVGTTAPIRLARCPPIPCWRPIETRSAPRLPPPWSTSPWPTSPATSHPWPIDRPRRSPSWPSTHSPSWTPSWLLCAGRPVAATAGRILRWCLPVRASSPTPSRCASGSWPPGRWRARATGCGPMWPPGAPGAAWTRARQPPWPPPTAVSAPTWSGLATPSTRPRSGASSTRTWPPRPPAPGTRPLSVVSA